MCATWKMSSILKVPPGKNWRKMVWIELIGAPLAGQLESSTERTFLP